MIQTCFFHVAADGSQEPSLANTISDDVFVTAVNFLHRRYLYGQSVLATAMREEAWDGIDKSSSTLTDEDGTRVVTVLRSHAEPVITRHSVLLVSLDLKRALEHGTSGEQMQAEEILQKLFRTMAALGLGEVLLDSDACIVGLHKYTRQTLSASAAEY